MSMRRTERYGFGTIQNNTMGCSAVDIEQASHFDMGTAVYNVNASSGRQQLHTSTVDIYIYIFIYLNLCFVV